MTFLIHIIINIIIIIIVSFVYYYVYYERLSSPESRVDGRALRIRKLTTEDMHLRAGPESVSNHLIRRVYFGP